VGHRVYLPAPAVAWPEVWEQNPQVKNPHRIYVGDVLWVGMEGGRPRLYSRHSRHVKLSPTVRASEHDRVVPPIPLDVIWPFLIQPRVVGPEDLADAPYVVSSQDEHLTPAETNRIYIRGLPPAEPGTQYTVVRCGEVYRDPPAQRDENTRYATLEPVALRYTEDCIGAEGGALGYEALQVADAVLERAGDPATAVITRSNREVLSGDRLLPLTGAVYPEFVPPRPAKTGGREHHLRPGRDLAGRSEAGGGPEPWRACGSRAWTRPIRLAERALST
jgi:hypothetical protein